MDDLAGALFGSREHIEADEGGKEYHTGDYRDRLQATVIVND